MFGMMGKDRSDWEQMASQILGKVTRPSFEMDVKDLGDSFCMEADLPGLSKGDLKVDVAGDLLTITVTRKSTRQEEEAHYIRRERFYGTAKRTFDVSAVDTQLITAQYDNGVLTIQMPKKESARTSMRSVTVE